MNIVFEHLQIQNFKSIGDLITLDFSEFQGVNFIIGNNKDNPGAKNGAGKTTICDAIVFALFGRAIKPVANQYIPNRNYKKKAESFAKLTFSIDGARYRSECYCGKSSVKLLLFRQEDGGFKDITQSSVLKTKQFIQEEVLKCTYDVFKSTIFISSSDCLNFYENMTKQQKRTYIENIFSLDCFGKLYDYIKSDMNGVKKDISFTDQELRKASQQFDGIAAKCRAYNEELNGRLEGVKKELQDKAALYKGKAAQSAKLRKSLEEAGGVDEEYAALLKKERAAEAKINELNNENFRIQTKIDSINQFIEKIDSIKTGLCEDCSRIIAERYSYGQQLDSIGKLNGKSEENTKAIGEIRKSVEGLPKEKSDLEARKKEFAALQSKSNALDVELAALKQTLKSLKSEYEGLGSQSQNPFNVIMESLDRDMKDAQDRLNRLNVDYKHLDILKSVCSENGVKQYIIKDIVVLLNSLIQKYLNEIGAEYIVCFDDTFDFKFLTVNGECEYNSFSAGERQRIQIATILAFRDLILNGKLNSNIFIIDEVLDMAIDAVAIKKIISILQRKTTEMNQALFIISHRSEITEENIFNHILEMIKENGVSRLKVI